MNVQQIEINNITLNKRVQQRVQQDDNVIKEYFEAVQAEAQFPPLTVFYDGEKLILADGKHRYEAYKLAGINVVNAEIINGSERDAILYAAGANADHGLRRTNKDKRYAVKTLLMDEEWGQWSDGAIAEKVRVTQPFVTKLRRKLSNNGYEFNSRRICANGRSMDTSNIGQRQPDSAEIEQPDESGLTVPESTEPSSVVQETEERDAGDDEPTANTESDGSDIEGQDDTVGLENENGIVSTEASGDVFDEVSDEDEGHTRESLSEMIKDAPSESFSSNAENVDQNEGSEPAPPSVAQTDDIKVLYNRIVDLEQIVREQDRELYLKDQRIAELEEEVDELKKSIEYFEGDVMAS
jgi:hypothetical protein